MDPMDELFSKWHKQVLNQETDLDFFPLLELQKISAKIWKDLSLEVSNKSIDFTYGINTKEIYYASEGFLLRNTDDEQLPLGLFYERIKE